MLRTRVYGSINEDNMTAEGGEPPLNLTSFRLDSMKNNVNILKIIMQYESTIMRNKIVIILR